MPIRHPHRAAPCLWAVRDRYDADDEVTNYSSRLEFSWTTPDDASDDQWRKGVEAALIAVHRASTDTSPVANFQRMLPGYTQSDTLSADQPARGGPRPPTADPDPYTRVSARPCDWSHWQDGRIEVWLGFEWSPSSCIAALDAPHEPGLYVLWDSHSADHPLL